MGILIFPVFSDPLCIGSYGFLAARHNLCPCLRKNDAHKSRSVNNCSRDRQGSAGISFFSRFLGSYLHCFLLIFPHAQIEKCNQFRRYSLGARMTTHKSRSVNNNFEGPSGLSLDVFSHRIGGRSSVYFLRPQVADFNSSSSQSAGLRTDRSPEFPIYSNSLIASQRSSSSNPGFRARRCVLQQIHLIIPVGSPKNAGGFWGIYREHVSRSRPSLFYCY